MKRHSTNVIALAGLAHRMSVLEPRLSETAAAKPQAAEKFQLSTHQTHKTDVGANGVQIAF